MISPLACPAEQAEG